MKNIGYLILVILMSIFCAACGSGSSSDSDSNSPVAFSSGNVIDGYLVGARVCLDLNDNARCDSGEPETVTGPGGTYTLQASEEQFANHSIIAEVIAGETIDEDNPDAPIENGYTLTTPPGQTLVTPFTTLVDDARKENPHLSTEQLSVVVRDNLGLDEDVNLFQNYVERNDTSTHQVAKNIAKALADGLTNALRQVETAGYSLSLEQFGAILSAVLDAVERIGLTIAEAETETEVPGIDIFQESGVVTTGTVDELIATERQEITPLPGSILDVVAQGMWEVRLNGDYEDIRDEGTGDRTGAKETLNVFSNSIKLSEDGGSLETADYIFQGNQWVENTDDRRSNLVLTDQGWQLVKDGPEECEVEPENDTTARARCPGESLQLVSLIQKDISERRIVNFFLEQLDRRGWAERIFIDEFKAAANVDATFSAGAVGYVFNFTALADEYDLHCDTDGVVSIDELDVENCNTARDLNGEPITTLEGVKVVANVEVAREQTHYFNGAEFVVYNDGSVGYRYRDDGNNEIRAQGSWSMETFAGIEIMVLKIPQRIKQLLDEPPSNIILTVFRGRVVIGDLEREGKKRVRTRIENINQTAYDDITQFLQNSGIGFPLTEQLLFNNESAF